MAAPGAWVGTMGAGGGNWEGVRAELLRPGLSATGEVMGLDLSVRGGGGLDAGAVTDDGGFLPAAAAGAIVAVVSILAGLTTMGVWVSLIV